MKYIRFIILIAAIILSLYLFPFRSGLVIEPNHIRITVDSNDPLVHGDCIEYALKFGPPKDWTIASDGANYWPVEGGYSYASTANTRSNYIQAVAVAWFCVGVEKAYHTK